jgi:hypothetical protein
MEFWDHIVHTALLGTDKRAINAGTLPSAVAEATALIQQNNSSDKEEQFLQTAALAFNYRQCGVMPLQKEGISITKAAAEEKQYGSALAMQTIKDILDAESNSLLQFWLQQCVAKERIVVPELVPVLLNAGIQQKKLQNLIVACCGKRGEWLSRFNTDWNFSTAGSNEELWQTGTLEQRKGVLQQLRQENAAEARTWLQQAWPQEDANTKTELLQLLATNIGEEDIVFLESLLAEKSKKVKDEAIKLLQKIPGSAIIQQYWQIVKQSVVVSGNASSKDLQINLVEVDESIFKTGIQKLSGDKNITDEIFILYQLVAFIPPYWWQEHFQLGPRSIIQLLQQHTEGVRLIPAIGMAAGRFKDVEWGSILIEDDSRFYYDMLPVLPKTERDRYLLKYFDFVGEMAIQFLTEKQADEWDLEITKAAFTFMAKNPYKYNRAFYSQHIHYIPAAIVPELEKCAPKEEGITVWKNNSEYIKKLINLKVQTIQSFNE